MAVFSPGTKAEIYKMGKQIKELSKQVEKLKLTGMRQMIGR